MRSCLKLPPPEKRWMPRYDKISFLGRLGRRENDSIYIYWLAGLMALASYIGSVGFVLLSPRLETYFPLISHYVTLDVFKNAQTLVAFVSFLSSISYYFVCFPLLCIVFFTNIDFKKDDAIGWVIPPVENHIKTIINNILCICMMIILMFNFGKSLNYIIPLKSFSAQSGITYITLWVTGIFFIFFACFANIVIAATAKIIQQRWAK